MLTAFIKFIHIITMLSMVTATLYCVVHQNALLRLNKLILFLATLTLITGTLLVYPKHFTFHTPWIQAAYLFLIIFCTGILILKKGKNFFRRFFWAEKITYLLLFMILILIIHDAVTKTTILF